MLSACRVFGRGRQLRFLFFGFEKMGLRNHIQEPFSVFLRNQSFEQNILYTAAAFVVNTLLEQKLAKHGLDGEAVRPRRRPSHVPHDASRIACPQSGSSRLSTSICRAYAPLEPHEARFLKRCRRAGNTFLVAPYLPVMSRFHPMRPDVCAHK